MNFKTYPESLRPQEELWGVSNCYISFRRSLILKKIHFLEQFQVHSKIEGKVQRVLIYPLPLHTHHLLPSVSTTGVLHLLQLMYWHWLPITQHPLFTVPVGGVRSMGLDKRSMTRGLPGCLSGKESPCQCRRCGFDPQVGKISWRRKWQPTLVFSPGKSHGQRSLSGYRPWGRKRVRHHLATKQQWHVSAL